MKETKPHDGETNSTTEWIGRFLFWASNHLRPIGPFPPVTVFRGHGQSRWDLLPTLCRKSPLSLLHKHMVPPEFKQAMVAQYESEIVSRFRTQFDLRDWTDIEVLAYAQHHKAPTTLLDWTANPLSALWFAVENPQYDCDEGTVFLLHLSGESGSDHRIVFAMPPLCLDGKCGHRVHVFQCPHKIDRSSRQRSLFSHASPTDAFSPLETVENASKQIARFSIPAAEKGNIRRLLTLLGLDPFSIYGDPDSFGRSIDGLFELPTRIAAAASPAATP
jgi:hypothetical protein